MCAFALPYLEFFLMYMYTYSMLMRDERSEQGQTNNKAKQHNTPKVVTFPKKNELPRVGLEPTTLYTLDRALYQNVKIMYGYTLTHTHSHPSRPVFQSSGNKLDLTAEFSPFYKQEREKLGNEELLRILSEYKR